MFELTECHSGRRDLHGVCDLGGGGGAAFCAQFDVAGRPRAGGAVGDQAFSNRRDDPESVQAFHARDGGAEVRAAVGLAGGKVAQARRGLQPGPGLDRVRALREAGRRAQGLQPSETRTGLTPSVTGGVGRSLFHSPRRVAEREHDGGARGGGVSERGAGQAAPSRMDSGDTGRCRIFRSGPARLPGSARVVVHRGGAPDPLAEAGGGAGSGVAGAGCGLRGGRVSLATVGMESCPRLCRGERTVAGDVGLAGQEAVRGAGLHLPDFRDQSSRSAGGDLTRLQSAGFDRATHRGVEIEPGGGWFLPEPVLCHRGSLLEHSDAVQPAGGIPVRGWPERLSPAGQLAGAGLPVGAILGRAGHRTVLHLSSAWGGLEKRNPLLDKLLHYEIPTSRKLDLQPKTAG